MSNEDLQNMKDAAKIMDAFKKQTQMMGAPATSIPPTKLVGTNEFDNQGGQFAECGKGNMVGMGFDNQGSQSTTNLVRPVVKSPVMNHPVAKPPISENTKVNTTYSTPVHSPAPTPPSTPYVPTATPASYERPSICPQCKTLHPPLKPGVKCPNVGVGDTLKSIGIDDAFINKNLVDMRNIIMAQMSIKGVKDGRKLFQYAIIELTKALENYKE